MTLDLAGGQSWRPGSRVVRLKASHSYRSALFLVLATFLFIMAAPDERWALSVTVLLLTGTLIVAIWVSGFGWSGPKTLTAAVVGLTAAAVAGVAGGETATGSVWLVGIVLAAAVIVVIALGVVDQGEVNSQSVVGAICVYLVLGMLFSFAYGSAAKLGSGYFFAQGTDGTPAIRLYFSYITMATVGYGDYSAAGNLGRTLSILEGLLGQLYLVTIVALLVSRLAHRQRDPA